MFCATQEYYFPLPVFMCGASKNASIIQEHTRSSLTAPSPVLRDTSMILVG